MTTHSSSPRQPDFLVIFISKKPKLVLPYFIYDCLIMQMRHHIVKFERQRWLKNISLISGRSGSTFVPIVTKLSGGAHCNVFCQLTIKLRAACFSRFTKEMLEQESFGSWFKFYFQLSNGVLAVFVQMKVSTLR